MKQNINTTTGSKDLQMVSITLRVLSRPDTNHLPKIYKSLGLDYDERVLPSIGNEVLKSIVAQFDAAELITQREVVCHSLSPSLLMTNHPNRCLHAFGRICLHVRGSSISSSRTCLSHISRLERYVFSLIVLPSNECRLLSHQEFTQAVEAKQIAQQGEFLDALAKVRHSDLGFRCGARQVCC